MIRVQSYRDEGGGEFSLGDSEMNLLAALRGMCIGELAWGGVVTQCRPVQITVKSLWMSQRDRTVFTGTEDDMAPLYRAALATDPGAGTSTYEWMDRHIQGSLTLPSPDAGVSLALCGMMQEKIGNDRALKALLAFGEITEPESVAAAAAMGPRALLCVLHVQSEGVSFGDAVQCVTRMQEALVRHGYINARHTAAEALLEGVRQASAFNLSMSTVLPAWEAALDNGLYLHNVRLIINYADLHQVSYADAAQNSPACCDVRRQAAEAAERARNWRPKPRWRRALEAWWQRCWAPA